MNHQTTLFDVLYPTFTFQKNKPLRVVELFSGIGFQAMGMELAEIPYEVVATCEIDEYAVIAYAGIHSAEFRDWVKTLRGNLSEKQWHKHRKRLKKQMLSKANILNNNLGDIAGVTGDRMPSEVDIMTCSFPCTDLSKAGKQKGLNNTRSGLVYEVLRILAELKDLDNLPKVLIMENVIDLVQTKFIKQFNEIQLELEGLGYINYVEKLNAKNYGIAQNRDRVFMVSILGEYNYNFPKPFNLEHRLKDYLEKRS